MQISQRWTLFGWPAVHTATEVHYHEHGTATRKALWILLPFVLFSSDTRETMILINSY